jgi:hypothetical protein
MVHGNNRSRTLSLHIMLQRILDLTQMPLRNLLARGTTLCKELFHMEISRYIYGLVGIFLLIDRVYRIYDTWNFCFTTLFSS